MNKMEEEMLASERLISIYKEASEDAEKQLKEITLDFEERGRLLAQMKIGKVIILKVESIAFSSRFSFFS